MTVDVSDTNRPTNLADRFSELYDNEWTKALDDLNKVKEEHEDGNIKLLADILEVQSKSLEAWVNRQPPTKTLFALFTNQGTNQ